VRRPTPPKAGEESFFTSLLIALFASAVLIGITYFAIWQVTQ